MSAATCWEEAYRAQVEAIKELRAENAELRAKLNDPARLHAHCVRYLTDAQVAHLLGERMTEIQNSRDKLEAKNAELLEQIEAWKCKYYDVADAICRESSGPEDICRQARELRDDIQQLDAENAALRARLKESEGWRSVGDRLNDRLKAEIVTLVAAARKEAQP